MTTLKKSLTIRPLEPIDAALITDFMSRQSAEYKSFFYAFGTDENDIKKKLDSCREDSYSGVFWRDTLISIFMLRGWDDGYEIPAFGVLVDEKFRGQSILSLTVDTAKIICRLAGAEKIMVKIHPNNTPLKNVHRMGFYRTGIEESTGNVIFHLNI